MTKNQAFIEGQSLGWDAAMSLFHKVGYSEWVDRMTEGYFRPESLESFLSWADLRTSNILEVIHDPTDLEAWPGNKANRKVDDKKS